MKQRLLQIVRRLFGRRTSLRSLLTLLTFVVSIAIIGLLQISRIDPAELPLSASPTFLDRSGIVLRYAPDAVGERHIPLPHGDLPLKIKQAFLAAEDERYYSHPGFDPAAISRAVKSNLTSGKIVSGASTITQQLSRMVYPRRRTYRDKAIEILRSARIEWALDKESILRCYLDRVPMANNIRGVELAARIYFGHAAKHLTWPEAALLAALPKAPSLLNPYGDGRDRLIKRRDWILHRLQALGYMDDQTLQDSLLEVVAFRPLSFPFEASHLVDRLLQQGESAGVATTTINLPLQIVLEQTLASHRERLRYKGADQAAGLIVDNRNMEVVATAGSLAYGAEARGFNNGTTALRSPGSALKPFLYSLALDSGFTASTLIEDVLRRYRTPEGDYTPANFDRKQYGPVTMRVALANSLNISAVRMLESVGGDQFYSFLSRIDLINDRSKTADYYGLGLVLGNPEVSLEQLAAAYGMLANGGRFRPLTFLVDKESKSAVQVLSSQAAYIISRILSDPTARSLTFGSLDILDFPHRVAIKTGTSSRYRDTWMVGYTPDYTIAVWTGNFPGQPTFGLSGAIGAGPIFRDLFERLYQGKTPGEVPMPDTVLMADACGFSGMKPGVNCEHVTRDYYIVGTEPFKECTFHKKSGAKHALPSSYAGWLDEKSREGTASGYRLQGQSDDFLSVLDGTNLPLSTESAVRVRNSLSVTTLASVTSSAEPIVRPLSGHIRIGEQSSSVIDSELTVQIVYPLGGDRFLLSRDRPDGQQAIKLEAVTSKTVAVVEWYVDGHLLTQSGLPYSAWWVPEFGRHTIVAVVDGAAGDAVEVVVE